VTRKPAHWPDLLEYLYGIGKMLQEIDAKLQAIFELLEGNLK
jgi:hypothetical protein